MSGDMFLNAVLGLGPVCLFLAALVHFDTFKLIRIETVFATLAAGAAAALVAYVLNTAIMARFDIAFIDLMHLVAPPLEEALKAVVIFFLIRFNRIGFAFDAAVLGFAAGAGFAIVENFYFLTALDDGHVAIWLVRGFGTAIMHGGTTAIFAMLGHILSLRSERASVLHFAAGFAIAVAFHMAFNFCLDYPVSSTLVMMLALPAVMTALLRRDQKSIRDWLEVDFSNHRRLLDDIRNGAFQNSEAGKFIVRLHDRFHHVAVDKMIYYVELHTELILAAEKILQAHEKGEAAAVDQETHQKLVLLHEVEDEIGKSALLVLRPHLRFTRHEFWEIYMLEKEAGFAHPRAH